MSVMNYKAVVGSVSRKTGLAEKIVDDVIQEFVETLVHNVSLGKTVQVDNFGSFTLRFLNRRTMPENYLTGEEAVAPAHFKITFKAYQPVINRITTLFREILVNYHG